MIFNLKLGTDKQQDKSINKQVYLASLDADESKIISIFKNIQSKHEFIMYETRVDKSFKKIESSEGVIFFLSKNHTREDLKFMKHLIQCTKSNNKAIIVIWLGNEEDMIKLPNSYNVIILNESSLEKENNLKKLDSFISRVMESDQSLNKRLVETRLFSIANVSIGKNELLSVRSVDLFLNNEIIIKTVNGILKLYNIHTGDLVSVIATGWNSIVYCWLDHLQKFLILSKDSNPNLKNLGSLFNKCGNIHQTLEIPGIEFSTISYIGYSRTTQRVFISTHPYIKNVMKELNEKFELNDSELSIDGTPTVFNDYIYTRSLNTVNVYDLSFYLLKKVNKIFFIYIHRPI